MTAKVNRREFLSKTGIAAGSACFASCDQFRERDSIDQYNRDKIDAFQAYHAGYKVIIDNDRSSVKGISGEWIIPKMLRKYDEYVAFGPKVLISGSHRSGSWELQAGTSFTNDLMRVFYTSKGSWSFWYQFNEFVHMKNNIIVKEGDRIKVDIALDKTNELFIISFTNLTRPAMADHVVNYMKLESLKLSEIRLAFWGIDRQPYNYISEITNLPEFGKVTFYNNVVRIGSSIKSLNLLNNRPLEMIDRKGKVLAAPSKITDDSTFIISYNP